MMFGRPRGVCLLPPWKARYFQIRLVFPAAAVTIRRRVEWLMLMLNAWERRRGHLFVRVVFVICNTRVLSSMRA